MKRITKAFSFVLVGLFGVLTGLVHAHEHGQGDGIEFSKTQIADGVYMLQGQGGNLGLLVGDDGSVLIDDDFDRNGAALVAAIKEAAGGAPDFVLNTHFHGDHTGGNLALGEAGSFILAHENVRAKLAEGSTVKEFNMVTMPAKAKALPILTYAEGISLFLNGNEVQVIHVPRAHTDGDSIVVLKQANVIHAGDTMFNGFFPFIDVSNGGTLSGMIRAAGLVAELSDENTKVIPGHGPLATKADVLQTKEHLETAYKRLSALKAEGRSVEEVIAAKPLADLDEKWGGVMFSADRWIGIVYNGLD